ncbi:hypothetical protein [Oscillibacter sp. MSJ-31]|uniref:hypothetical protein n=1 Tax=Oscillibacter sp. MSJ-31 TaxID=2841526 RepID=UPI001C117121|nr:hypothetical protein [Oscillibacter sp. MSJ-31]MBU5457782.1 hypothetical protein [Oscillibacter sp. MSJ-31]
MEVIMKNLSVYTGTTKAWNWAINGGSVVQLSEDLLNNATVLKEGNGNAYLEHPVIDDIVVLVPGRYHSGSTDITCGVILDKFITCTKTGETFNTVDILSQFKWGISTTNGGRGYVVAVGCEGTAFQRRKLGIEDVILAYAVNGRLEPVVSPAVRGNYNIHHKSFVWDLRVKHLALISKKEHQEYHHTYSHKSHQRMYTLTSAAGFIPVLAMRAKKTAKKQPAAVAAAVC